MPHDLGTRLVLTASWWRLELPTWQALLSLVPCQLLALSLGAAFVLVQIGLILNVYFRDRSRINGDVGGRTQMASLICSGIVLLSMFFLLPWLYSLPKCVLGSMFVGNLVHHWFIHFIASNFSIARIVFSLLAETPHEIVYYFRFGIPFIIPPRMTHYYML